MDFQLDTLGSLASLAIVGTVFGAVLRGWSSIKSFFQSLFRFIVIEAKLEDNKTSQIVLAHLVNNYKQSSTGIKVFGGKHESFKAGKYGHVPYEFFGDRSVVFWKGWIPFWFKTTAEKPDEKAIIWGETPKKNNM